MLRRGERMWVVTAENPFAVGDQVFAEACGLDVVVAQFRQPVERRQAQPEHVFRVLAVAVTREDREMAGQSGDLLYQIPGGGRMLPERLGRAHGRIE